jgi:hypothetical protein
MKKLILLSLALLLTSCYTKTTCPVELTYILGLSSITYTDLKLIIDEHQSYTKVYDTYGEPVSVPKMNRDTLIACYGISTARTKSNEKIYFNTKEKYIDEYIPDNIQCIAFVNNEAQFSYESELSIKDKSRLKPKIMTESTNVECEKPSFFMEKIVPGIMVGTVIITAGIFLIILL